MIGGITEAQEHKVRANRCPDCLNWGFIGGPRGGAGQNIYCANPGCRAAFMIAPRHAILLVQRVDKAPEAFYPPQVHILEFGRPLCNFSMEPFPENWPIGHSWVGIEDQSSATCPTCREFAARGRPPIAKRKIRP